MNKRLTVYSPGHNFPSFSVTGTWCALRCEHCKGRFLRGMISATSSAQLLDAARAAKARGARGILVSGGCDAEGRVPLAPFIGAIARLRSEGLMVNVHTGLLDEAAARELASASAEAFSVDLLQDPEVIRSSLHMEATPEDYENTLRALLAAGARVVPHVCVGLQQPDAEQRCLDLLSRLPIAAVVVLALLPPPGQKPLPGLEDRLVNFIENAASLPCPVLLGCMRPRGWWETEVRCIQAGVAGIVNPSSRTVAWARANGYEVATERLCCALHR